MDTWSLARLRVVLAVALLVLVLSLILLSGLADGDYEAISSSAVKDFYWIDVSYMFKQHELALMNFSVDQTITRFSLASVLQLFAS